MPSYDKIIYGRQSLENIVSVEIDEDKATLFLENEKGITTQVVKNKFWILAHVQIDPSWVRLKGNQHYRWGKQFSTRKEYLDCRARFYKRNIDFYTVFDPKDSFLTNYGYTYFKGKKIKDVSILSFDIETTSLKFGSDSKVLLISNTFRRNGTVERRLFSFDDYATPKEFIDSWASWVREKDPSILTTYNGTSFDIPYLSKYAKSLGTSLFIGRDGSDVEFSEKESSFRKDGSQSYSYHKLNVYGRSHIDMFFGSIRYDIGRKYPSYQLKQIIKFEGLEKENRQFYDASKIRDNYHIPEEMVKIKEYCKDDSDDCLALFDLMMPATFYLTQSIPKPFQNMIESATGSQFNSLLVRSYLQEGYSIPKADQGGEFLGGISQGIPGVYSNVASIDLVSLYPSVMLQHGLFPKAKDPNNNFLYMLNYFREERLKNKALAKETKDNYYTDLEQTGKIGINSCYGLLGAKGLNFNDVFQAAEVTKYSREYLNKTVKYFTDMNIDEWRKDNGIEEEVEDG